MEPTTPSQPELAPTNPRCKTCKVPLADASWKNCDRCRRNRTESYNRWKKSAQARKSIITGTDSDPASSASSLPPVTEIPSTSRLNLNAQPSIFVNRTAEPPRLPHLPHVQPNTPAQDTGTDTTPSYYRSNGRDHPTGTSQLSGGTPRPAPVPFTPPRIIVPEYQWCDELVDEFAALPPRSNFVGKFSIVRDPQVDNPARADIFLSQLRAKGSPASCAIVPFISLRMPP